MEQLFLKHFIMFQDLNFAAVTVSTIAAFALGFFWYGPFFGKEWMHELKIKKTDFKGPMWPPMVKGLLNTFVLVTVACYFLSFTSASNWLEGVLQGIVMGVGLTSTILFGEVNWEGRSTKLFMINALYYVVTLAMVGAIYTQWPA